ncbi:hypothetical protein ACIQAL_20860 [Pseudomonas sp. NPDC088368]|jgi:uncharacterized membrane protein|uniref:glycosyltransferase family 39 protein n=1 Tax=Pseudomonas sp. NPDC088368 TaxID=3364453 RepID=UPI00381887C1
MDDGVVVRRSDSSDLRDACLWGVILIAAAAVRLYQLDWAALWYDEAFSRVMSTHSLGELWSISVSDVHPPLYYLVLKGWIALLGDGLIAMRGLNAFASVLTVGMGMWLTRLVSTRRAAVFAGILLVMLPIAVRYSHEVRMYALLAVWMTGATIALVYWMKAPSRYMPLVIYALLITAGLYTHYFAILGVLSHWLCLLAMRPMPNETAPRLILRPAWWLANLTIALLFLPWLPVFVAQLGQSSNLGWIHPVTLSAIPSALWQYLTLVNGAQWPALARWAPVPVLAGICIFCLLRDTRPERLSLLLVIYLWAPLLVIFVVSWQLPLFVARYFLFSALALPIVVGIALDDVARTRTGLAVIGCLILIGIEAFGMRNLYGEYDTTNADGHETQERINLIAEWIDHRYQPTDQVVVLNYFWYPSLVYYSRHAGKPLLYAPRVQGSGAECVVYCRFKAPYASGQDDFYLESLSHLPAGTARVWLVDGADATDFQLTLPCQWRWADTQIRGDNRLRLYDVRQGGSRPCPTP